MTHYGKCIDDKTPLLRSCDAVKAQGVSLGLLTLRSRWWSRAVTACPKVTLFAPPRDVVATLYTLAKLPELWPFLAVALGAILGGAVSCLDLPKVFAF